MEIRLTKRRLSVLGVLILGVGGYVLLDWLIVTDAERVEETLDRLEAAVETSDAEAVMPFLDDSFRLGGMNPEEFRAWYAELLKRMHVKNVSQYDRKVEIDKADRNVAYADVQTCIELDRPASEQRIDWRLEFRRRGEEGNPNPDASGLETPWKLVVVRAYWPRNGQEIPLKTVPEMIP